MSESNNYPILTPPSRSSGRPADQPPNINEQNGCNFKVEIDRLNGVAYFCKGLNLPGISIGQIPVNSQSLATLYFPAKPIQHNPFSMNFIVSEDLNNWLEVYRWMYGLSDPLNIDAITRWIESREQRDMQYHADVTKIFGQVRIYILSNAKNPTHLATLHHAFPIGLGDLPLSTDNAERLTCDCSFAYSHVELAKLT